MVNFCIVPGCSNRSDKETSLSYFHLPLKNQKLMKTWIHKIGRKNLPLNNISRVCSVHFHNARGRLLRQDEYPVLNVPSLVTTVRQRKPPASRTLVFALESEEEDTSDHMIHVCTSAFQPSSVNSNFPSYNSKSPSPSNYLL